MGTIAASIRLIGSGRLRDFARLLWRGPELQERVPINPGQPSFQPGLPLIVVFTGLENTLAALREAEQLAAGLYAHVLLIIPIVVPYRLPLTSPPVSPGFFVRRLRRAMRGRWAHICLCRDFRQVCREVLKPRSLVVIAGRKRWWLTREERQTRELEAAGHHTVFVDVR